MPPCAAGPHVPAMPRSGQATYLPATRRELHHLIDTLEASRLLALLALVRAFLGVGQPPQR